jgi:hypothetical protein
LTGLSGTGYVGGRFTAAAAARAAWLVVSAAAVVAGLSPVSSDPSSRRAAASMTHMPGDGAGVPVPPDAPNVLANAERMPSATLLRVCGAEATAGVGATCAGGSGVVVVIEAMGAAEGAAVVCDCAAGVVAEDEAEAVAVFVPEALDVDVSFGASVLSETWVGAAVFDDFFLGLGVFVDVEGGEEGVLVDGDADSDPVPVVGELTVEGSPEVEPLEGVPPVAEPLSVDPAFDGLELEEPELEAESDDEPVFVGSAQTGAAAIADPTPSATANAPTRPTYLAQPMTNPPIDETSPRKSDVRRWTQPSALAGRRDVSGPIVERARSCGPSSKRGQIVATVARFRGRKRADFFRARKFHANARRMRRTWTCVTRVCGFP